VVLNFSTEKEGKQKFLGLFNVQKEQQQQKLGETRETRSGEQENCNASRIAFGGRIHAWGEKLMTQKRLRVGTYMNLTEEKGDSKT